MKYKNIRVSNSVLTDLKALQKEGESIPDTINRLSEDFSWALEGGIRWDFEVQVNNGYCLVIETMDLQHSYLPNNSYYEKELKKDDPIDKVMRLPEKVVENIKGCTYRHPDQTLNTSLFIYVALGEALNEWGVNT